MTYSGDFGQSADFFKSGEYSESGEYTSRGTTPSSNPRAALRQLKDRLVLSADLCMISLNTEDIFWQYLFHLV